MKVWDILLFVVAKSKRGIDSLKFGYESALLRFCELTLLFLKV